MLKLAVALFSLLAVGNAAPTKVARSTASPTAKVRNGTYVGVTNTHYQQDFFLGMPYAQQPLGDLRFTVPQSLNESWSGERDAKEYSNICVGYGVSAQIFFDIQALLAASWHYQYNLMGGSVRPTRFGTHSPKLV